MYLIIPWGSGFGMQVLTRIDFEPIINWCNFIDKCEADNIHLV